MATSDQIEAGLRKLKSKTAKLKAPKVQLDFCKKALQQTHPNKITFQSSHLGHQFSVDEMKSQLLCNAGHEQPRIGVRVPSDITGKQIHHRWIVIGENEWFSG